MRLAVEVVVRVAAFVALWLSWPDAPTPTPEDAGRGWVLFIVVALLAFLWGVVDGLMATGSLTRAMLGWALTAPLAAGAVALLGGVSGEFWPQNVDTIRWVVVLALMFYFLLVLPAGLGVATGSAVQGLGRSLPRR